MEEQIIYLETGSVDPHYNLAFEEYVLCNRTEGSYLMLWQNDNTVVIERNQNAEAEINRPFVEEHHIHVVRRTTGGGAVYHDLGNLNYSFITDAGESNQLAMERFTRPVVEALKALGLHHNHDGEKTSGLCPHSRIVLVTEFLGCSTEAYDVRRNCQKARWNDRSTGLAYM